MELAREYLKGEKKTKINMARDFYRESRSTYRYPFCSEQVFIKKRQTTRLNILVTWLNSGDNSHLLSPRLQRGKGVVIVREGSGRVITVYFFLVGGFTSL